MKINTSFIYFFIFIFLYIASFFLKLDIAGGSFPDLKTHWTYIQKLSSVGLINIFDIETGEKSANGIDSKLLNFPLHHIIFSQIFFINKNLNAYLNLIFIISFLVPLLFYICCAKRFVEIEKKKLLVFSSIIFILPNFQSSGIWGNNHNTAIIFFLISIFYLIKIENSTLKKNKDIFFTYLFLFLSMYTKQYYVIFFPIVFLKIFLKYKFDVIFITLISCIILSIPGIIFLYNNLGLFNNLIFTATNFSSSIIVVASIISFYLIPFLYVEIQNNKFYFKNLVSNKKFIIYFIIFFIFIIFASFNFIYHKQIGGGAFIKLNNLFFNDYFYFIILSTFLSSILIYFSTKNNTDIFLTTILLISFSSGWFIFQKYFEPTYFIVFALLYDKKMLTNLIKNNLSPLYSYFFIYWILYFIYRQKDKLLTLI